MNERKRSRWNDIKDAPWIKGQDNDGGEAPKKRKPKAKINPDHDLRCTEALIHELEEEARRGT